MQAFNNSKEVKRSVVDFAASRGELVTDSAQRRETIFWSQNGWCPGSDICQKEGKCKHRFYADEIGVPVAVAYAERSLFLHLPDGVASRWWKDFLQAIPVGADLEAAQVWKQMALYVLADKEHGLLNFAVTPEHIAAIKGVIALYEQDCTDKEAWEVATDDAIIAGISRYNGGRIDASEANFQAGSEACDAAQYFASCFADQRFASEALERAGWCFRFKVYAQHMSSPPNPRAAMPVDKHGMVRLGAALLASGEWMEISEAGERLGEAARFEHYERMSKQFLQLLKDSNGVSGGRRILRQLLSRFA